MSDSHPDDDPETPNDARSPEDAALGGMMATMTWREGGHDIHD